MTGNGWALAFLVVGFISFGVATFMLGRDYQRRRFNQLLDALVAANKIPPSPDQKDRP